MLEESQVNLERYIDAWVAFAEGVQQYAARGLIVFRGIRILCWRLCRSSFDRCKKHGRRSGLQQIRYAFDATAAKAMLTRRGFGRAKHIHRSYLWLQQRINEKDLDLKKVGTKVNPSDIGTKHLDGRRIVELIREMGLRFETAEHIMTLHV